MWTSKKLILRFSFDPTSNWNCLWVKVICFWHLPLGLWHRSCNFRNIPSEFKLNHANVDIAQQWLFLHFLFFITISLRFLYLVELCNSSRPQILQEPLIILTSFWVLGFTFTYAFWFTVSLYCRPPKQYFRFESININKTLSVNGRVGGFLFLIFSFLGLNNFFLIQN